MLNIFKVLFCLNAVFVQSKSSREYPSLHRSRRLSSTDICTLKTEVIHPTDFVRNHVCKNMMIREFIEQSICDGVSDCFKCDTENVRIVGESSLTVAKCNIIPELNLIDRHMASHLCYGLASEHTWNMCVSEKNFNLLHCPAVTLFMELKHKSFHCCRRQLRNDMQLSCRPKHSGIEYNTLTIRKNNGMSTTIVLPMNQSSSCCVTLTTG